jgi:uncharacterized protein involved in exopolysaccharide biosynthesis
MTESLKLPRSLRNLKVDWGLRQRYLGLGLAVNAAIWGTALVYLMFAPRTYVSEWTAIMPGSGERSTVNLPGIGEANSQTQSAFGSVTQDPRENYKYIAGSKPVLEAAASELNMDVESFGGAPEVQIIDNTRLMQFSLEGTNPEELELKSVAFHKAFQTRLVELRIQESAERDTGLQGALATSKRKLFNAQRKLSQYQARSGYSSADQIANLSSNIEGLRRERAQLLAQLNDTEARLQQLSTNLNLSPQQATDAFSLQSDPEFQQTTGEYAKTTAALVDLTSRFTANHPAVIDAKAKQAAARAELLSRSRSLFNKPVALKSVERLSLNNTVSDSSREQLFQDLIAVQVDHRGLQSRAQEVDRQLAQLEARLKDLTQQKAVADDLQRDVQINEAVFSSTLARLDLGGSDAFGSYPQIQLVTEPKVDEPPLRMFVLLGAAAGSMMATAGVGLLWLRQSRNQAAAGNALARPATSAEYIVINQ